MGDSHVLSMTDTSWSHSGSKFNNNLSLVSLSLSLSAPAAKNARERTLLCVWTNDDARREAGTKWTTNPGGQAESAGRIFSVQL